MVTLMYYQRALSQFVGGAMVMLGVVRAWGGAMVLKGEEGKGACHVEVGWHAKRAGGFP